MTTRERDNGVSLEQRLADQKRLLEQQVSVALDMGNGVAVFDVRERFDVKPQRVIIPFAVLDFVQWQRLTHQVQASGMLGASLVGANGAPVGSDSIGGHRAGGDNSPRLPGAEPSAG
jgi:hypothetical protein